MIGTVAMTVTLDRLEMMTVTIDHLQPNGREGEAVHGRMTVTLDHLQPNGPSFAQVLSVCVCLAQQPLFAVVTAARRLRSLGSRASLSLASEAMHYEIL